MNENNFITKVTTWIKNHIIIVIPVVAAIATAVILGVCLPIINKDTLTFTPELLSLYAGTQDHLTIQSKKGRSYTPEQLVYHSSDESVATVDANGTVRGVKYGTVTITCETAKGRCDAATAEVTVKNDMLSFAEGSSLTLTAGDTRTLTVKTESGLSYPLTDYQFMTNNSSVVTVDDAGKLTAVGAGVTTITAHKRDGTSNTAIINVTVKMKPVSIKSGEMIVRASGSKKAPLKVEVGTGKNYYLYFKNKSTASNDFAFYLASGKSTRFNVPLGTYTVYYATGQTWYGKKALFGPETVMLKLNGDVKFYKTSRAYVGHSIQLYPVQNGNVSSSSVGSAEFPK